MNIVGKIKTTLFKILLIKEINLFLIEYSKYKNGIIVISSC